MDAWLREIKEIHDVFETYFLGATDSLDRVEQVFAADFAHVGPTGIESSRDQTMAQLVAGHAHTNSLDITVTDGALLIETADLLVARYVENHHLADRSNHRLATVVLSPSPEAPNGLLWRRVHETWVAPPG